MDEISVQYDPTDLIYLKDIERILNDNKANDSENFVPKFDLNYMKMANAGWLVKSHKRSQKSLMSTLVLPLLAVRFVVVISRRLP